MHVLVTGAAGFIGMHTARVLLARGFAVTGVDNFAPYYDVALKHARVAALRGLPGFSFVQHDLADADRTARLFRDGAFTHVVHLAAQPGVRHSLEAPDAYVRDNLVAFGHVLEGCRHARIAHLVYASSSSVYGDEAPLPMREDMPLHPVSPYGVTKLAAEQLCYLYHVNYGVPAVSLRYFTVYGPRQRPDMGFNRFFRAILRNDAIVQYGDGRQTRDFTFVADAARATHDAASRGVPGRVYNIGGGSRVSLLDVFALLRTVTGRDVRIEVQPSQKGDMRDTYADTSLARADLGFAPSVNLEDGLRAMYRWMEATHA